MQLETYISDLLYRYECVTVPGFGSFLTRRVSATIHESTHAFYPPKKMLSFNEQIHQNDGLLVRYIADVEKIPYEASSKKVEKYVSEVKSFLTEGETITFKNIGDLSLNSEGNMLFEPSYHLNYLTDAFGLSQFTSDAVTREEYKKEVEEIEKVIPLNFTPEKRQEEKIVKSNSSRPYLKYAAVAVIALGLGGFFASNYYLGQIENHNQLAQEEANQQLETQIQEATFVIESPLPAATFQVKKQLGNFHIIAGAFRLEENSDKKVEELKQLGFNARKIGENRYGLHEVVYGSYETREDALKELSNIQNNYNKDAWMLIKDLN